MEYGKKISGKLADLFRLSRSQARGVLVLLPLLAVVGLIIHGTGRPKSDPDFIAAADEIAGSSPTGHFAVDPESADRGLFFFDPNTVTLEELCRLGFELRTAASIIKYRNAGKVFETAEDLAMCYGVTLEQYLAVEPYIIIGEPYRSNKKTSVRPSLPDANPAKPQTVPHVRVTAPFNPNELDEYGYTDLGFTPSQARTIINYRNSIGGFTSAEQFGRCYAVTPEALEKLTPYMVFDIPNVPATDNSIASRPEDSVVFPVEINGADSATLRAVNGIGEVMVVRIMEYCGRLGGFYRSEQLAEVKGMTQANYERIIQQITVDTCKISKIDINFATPKELVERMERHPYATERMAGKLLSARQLKGGYTNTQELVEDKILSKEEAGKLAPYLLFNSLDKE